MAKDKKSLFFKKVFPKKINNKEEIANLESKEDSLKLVIPKLIESKEVEIALMMVDFRNLPTLLRKVMPSEVINRVDRYLTLISEIVSKYGGKVDKLLGDTILVTFAKDQNFKNPDKNSVFAAKELVKTVSKINEPLEREGKTVLKIGCTIHYGHVISVKVISGKREEYTIVGDSVDILTRVKALARRYQLSILITDDLFENFSDIKVLGEVEPKGGIPIDGRKNSLSLYSIK